MQLQTGEPIGKVNFISRTSKPLHDLKAIRTDNGGEYISAAFKNYLNEHGIEQQLTVSYTPQQNGVAERMNRTSMDLVRSMLFTAGLSKEFWAEALQTAVYVRNRVTSRALNSQETPHYLWTGSKPDLSHLRAFGTERYYTIPRKLTKKLDVRARKAIFVGYSNQSKALKLWDCVENKMVISRDVAFREKEEAKRTEEPSENEDEEFSNQGGDNSIQFDNSSSEESEPESPNGPENGTETVQNVEVEQEPTVPTLRRSSRKFTKTKPFWVSLLGFALSAQSVPLSYKEANSPDNIEFWQPAIEREHSSLLRNDTWILVDRAPSMHVLPCKYVFRVKDGKGKARLVVLGCRQVYGLDYYHTFDPVVKFTTIRCLLAAVAVHDWECEQMDVVTAFLNGDLVEDIYMDIPEGFKSVENVGKVCKLRKALYGLKQAPRQWYSKIHNFFVNDLKFICSINDPCLYTLIDSSGILIIALYVDDLLIIGDSRSRITELKEKFKQKSEMKDMGPIGVLLGVEVKRDRAAKTLFLSQKEYLMDVLRRFRMDGSRPVSTPMERRTKGDDGSILPADVPYRQAIGSLIYLISGTRPDIAFAVSKLSQFLDKPCSVHWVAVKRIFRYLSGTRDDGLLFDGSKGLELQGYSDSDYAGDVEKMKSTSGYIFILAGGPVSWKSKKTVSHCNLYL